MTDKLTPQKRSWNMSRIKGKNTGPEMTVRSMLHKAGYRFRLHRKDLPGKPDLVLPKYKTVIFIHGCFWHAHGCKDSGIPKSNIDFWKKKLTANVERDQKNKSLLNDAGWKTLYIWNCEIKNSNDLFLNLENTISQQVQ